MFTGIIQCVGSVVSVEQRGGDLRLCLDAGGIGAEHLQLGASVAVAGVCLTVAERTARGFCADVSRATLALTTIGSWRAGARVNLEPALRARTARRKCRARGDVHRHHPMRRHRRQRRATRR